MAWTDQCRVAFKVNADGLLWTQPGKKNISRILRQLSQESDIPYKTLRRWWYEEENRLKNGTNGNFNEITNAYPAKDGDAVEEIPPKCEICGKPAAKHHRRKDGTYTYRDKCWSCVGRTTDRRPNRYAYQISCPHCGREFGVAKKEIDDTKDGDHLDQARAFHLGMTFGAFTERREELRRQYQILKKHEQGESDEREATAA